MTIDLSKIVTTYFVFVYTLHILPRTFLIRLITFQELPNNNDC